MMKIRSEQEKRIYNMITEEMPVLPYALKEVESDEYGKEYVYDIPDSEKSKVLENLFVFQNVPSMSDVMLDLHTRRTFVVKDFLVIRYNNRNMIVSPYYFENSGTLLDFVPMTAIVANSQQ